MLSQVITERAKFIGAKRNVQILNFRPAFAGVLMVAASLIAACGGGGTAGPGGVDMNETAATVNGKVIKMQEVEQTLRQQGQGQEKTLSDLELAGARLQILQSLIEQEVMYQKAEKESTVPTEEEVTAEINNRKTQSGKSADQIAKEMADAGVTEAALRESVKKELAIQNLLKKITGRVESPKDAEIEAFYNGNKSAFVKKRGVKLAAIVIDPANNGEGDATADEQTAVLRANEVIKKLQSGQDFSALVQQYSEDQSRFQNGDLGWVTEEDMRQSFPEQLTATLMSPQSEIGKVYTARMMGKLYILKLQDRSDKDEALTLDSPGVRQKVADTLVNNRKQLLTASYQAIAMNEARVENYLAKKVVENPNELSGARPAQVATATPSPAANTNGTVTDLSNANSTSVSNGTGTSVNRPVRTTNSNGNLNAQPKTTASPAR